MASPPSSEQANISWLNSISFMMLSFCFTRLRRESGGRKVLHVCCVSFMCVHLWAASSVIWLREKCVVCLSLELQQIECALMHDVGDLFEGGWWTHADWSWSNVLISYTPNTQAVMVIFLSYVFQDGCRACARIGYYPDKRIYFVCGECRRAMFYIKFLNRLHNAKKMFCCFFSFPIVVSDAAQVGSGWTLFDIWQVIVWPSLWIGQCSVGF